MFRIYRSGEGLSAATHLIQNQDALLQLGEGVYLHKVVFNAPV